MATDVSRSGNIIEITWSTGLTDFDFAVDMPADIVARGFVNVERIHFLSSGADTLVIREGSLTGPAMMREITTGVDTVSKDFNGTALVPYIEADNQTFVAFGNVSVVIVLSKEQSIG